MSKDIGFYALFFVIGVFIMTFSIIEKSRVMLVLGTFITVAVIILFNIEDKKGGKKK